MTGHITLAATKESIKHGAVGGASANVDDISNRSFDFKPLLPFTLLVIVGSFFGGTTVNGKVAILAGWHPITFLALSATAGGLLMMAGLRLFGVRMDFTRPVLAYSLVSGLMFALPNIFFFLAVVHVGAGFVALVTAFSAVLTYIFSVIIRTERFAISRAGGVVIALVGALALSVGKLTGAGPSPFWVLVAMLGPVFLALGNIYRSWAWPKGASPYALAPLMLIFAGLFAVLIVVFLGAPIAVNPSIAMTQSLVLQILIFAVGFAFYFLLQKIAGAVYLSQIGPIIAFVGSSLGILVLGEEISLSLLIGGVAIVGGVLIFNFSK
ncbi:DMT family transporter [Maritalea sp.]|uniref:DMT family transporter n=1 Tax=Maritalea sp. TaxID=2003361 RepID=UPI003EF3BF56